MIFSKRATAMTETEPAFDDLDELAEQIPQVPPPSMAARLATLPPPPDYIHPRDDISATGRLAAQAVALEHEKAAKMLEATAAELVNVVQQNDQDCLRVVEHTETVNARINAVVKECHEAAAARRAEAQTVYQRIEDSSALADSIHRTMQDAFAQLRARVAPDHES